MRGTVFGLSFVLVVSTITTTCVVPAVLPPPTEVADVKVGRIIDRVESLPRRYFEAQYETALVKHLRAFIQSGEAKGAIARLRLIPAEGNIAKPILVAQVLKVGADSVVRLSLGSYTRAIHLEGAGDPHYFSLEGERYEFYRLELNRHLGEL